MKMCRFSPELFYCESRSVIAHYICSDKSFVHTTCINTCDCAGAAARLQAPSPQYRQARQVVPRRLYVLYCRPSWWSSLRLLKIQRPLLAEKKEERIFGKSEMISCEREEWIFTWQQRGINFINVLLWP